MIDRDIIVDIRKCIRTEGPHKTPVFSEKHEVYGTLVDAGAIEKERAKANGMQTILRVDINEEEFDNETFALIKTEEYNIYKYAPVKNKVLLYLSKRK